MISLERAREATDKRLERLPMPTGRYVEIDEVVGPLCLGTDLVGAELAEEIRLTLTEVTLRMTRGEGDLSAVLGGTLLRAFLLGYEARAQL